MAIGIRASGSVTYDVHQPSSTVITKPAAAAAGDVAILLLSYGWATGAARSMSLTAGWTGIAINVGSTGTLGERTDAYYRVIQAGDTTWTATPSVTGIDLGITFIAFTGVDNTTPIDATGTTATNSASNTITAPLVTVVTNQSWELIGIGSYMGGGCTATGFTEFANAGSNEYAGVLYNTTPKSTGSTGTVVVTTAASATGNVMSAIPFALRPAGGGVAFMPPGPIAFRQAVKRASFY